MTTERNVSRFRDIVFAPSAISGCDWPGRDGDEDRAPVREDLPRTLVRSCPT